PLYRPAPPPLSTPSPYTTLFRSSPVTSGTLDISCQHSVGHSNVTAGDKPEEGGADVKSSCPLCPGRHTCYNGWNKGQRSGDALANPIKPFSVRIAGCNSPA